MWSLSSIEINILYFILSKLYDSTSYTGGFVQTDELSSFCALLTSAFAVYKEVGCNFCAILEPFLFNF